MLSLGFTQLPLFNSVPTNSKSQSFLFPIRIKDTHFPFVPNRVTQLGICTVLGQFRNGSCSFALKSLGKGSEFLMDMEDIDLDDDDDEEMDDDDDDDDEDDVIVPIRNMKKWLENKPAGFGEGKEYDTSVEDKLAQEIEQSRLAQLANINKLKSNPQNTNAKNQQVRKPKGSEAVPTGVPVRLVNLPRKKNIHRDLQQAFKGVQGITSIVPVVSGNKNTREPICKGTAFVYFKSKDEANRFIQVFSKQSIAFGKIQKQIKYKMMSSNSQEPASGKSVDNGHAPHLAEANVENDLDAESDMEDPPLISVREIVSEEYDSEKDEDVSTFTEVLKEESSSNSLSLKKQQKSRIKKKKSVPKEIGEKAPKLNSLGSANRLKVKEKAVLTDVFSKYGSKLDMAVKEK